MTLLQDYTSLKGDESNDDLAWLLHLDRLILSAEAELRWLERVEARLDTMSSSSEPVKTTDPISEPLEVTS
jgi:hypothetical protein